MQKGTTQKTHITLDLGPTTVIMLSELLLVVLKLLGHIEYSWTLVLSPILIVIFGAALILLTTLFKLLKNHIF